MRTKIYARIRIEPFSSISIPGLGIIKNEFSEIMFIDVRLQTKYKKIK